MQNTLNPLPGDASRQPPREQSRAGWVRIGLPVVACAGLLAAWGWFFDKPEAETARRADRAATQTKAPPGKASARSSTSTESDDSKISLAVHEEPANSGSIITASADGSDDSRSDADFRRRIVGKWQDEYFGRRYLTVEEDGAAKMIVQPSGIGKKLFAEELAFTIEWAIEDGKVSMKTTGGEPASKVKLVTRLYGEKAEYTILEMTADRMLLLDADGKTKYDWRRPEE